MPRAKVHEVKTSLSLVDIYDVVIHLLVRLIFEDPRLLYFYQLSMLRFVLHIY